jgi:hypothetical protein
MLEALSRDERLLLIKFVCAYAWTDLEIHVAERRFVERLVKRLGLDATTGRGQQWLHVAPSRAGGRNANPSEHRQASRNPCGR